MTDERGMKERDVPADSGTAEEEDIIAEWQETYRKEPHRFENQGDVAWRLVEYYLDLAPDLREKFERQLLQRIRRARQVSSDDRAAAKTRAFDATVELLLVGCLRLANAVPMLLRLTGHPDPAFRTGSIGALGIIGGPLACRRLAAIVRRRPGRLKDPQDAARALCRLIKLCQHPARDLLPLTVRRSIRAMAQSRSGEQREDTKVGLGAPLAGTFAEVLLTVGERSVGALVEGIRGLPRKERHHAAMAFWVAAHYFWVQAPDIPRLEDWRKRRPPPTVVPLDKRQELALQFIRAIDAENAGPFPDIGDPRPAPSHWPSSS